MFFYPLATLLERYCKVIDYYFIFTSEMKKLILLLSLLCPIIAFSQGVVVQQQPVQSSPSNPNFNKQVFQYANVAFQYTVSLPVMTNASLNNATPRDGIIVPQLSDTTIQIYLLSCHCFVPFGGKGSGGATYFSGNYFSGLGTSGSPIIFAPTISMQSDIHWVNNAHILSADNLRINNAPSNNLDVIRKVDTGVWANNYILAHGFKLNGTQTIIDGSAANVGVPLTVFNSITSQSSDGGVFNLLALTTGRKWTSEIRGEAPLRDYAYTWSYNNGIVPATVKMYLDTSANGQLYDGAGNAYLKAGGGGFVPTSRTLTINGSTQDLSTNRTWSVGTVTSIAANRGLTGGTITSTGGFGLDTTKNYTWLKRQTINFNTVNLTPNFPTQTQFYTIGADGQSNYHEHDAIGGHTIIGMYRGDGTAGSITGLVTNDEIGAIAWNGWYDATHRNSDAAASHIAVAHNNWSSTDNSTDQIFKTVPSGSTTLTSAFEIGQDGSVGAANNVTAGQLNTSNLWGGGSGNRGFTAVGTAGTSNQGYLELAAPSNNTGNVQASIFFEGLSQTLQSNYRLGAINVIPAGGSAGNQNGQLQLYSKGSGGLAPGITISQTQTVAFPAYTTNGGIFYGNGSGLFQQSAAITGIIKGNGTSAPTAAVSNTDYLPPASPAMTGTPTAPTATVGTNTTQVATTAYVQQNANHTALVSNVQHSNTGSTTDNTVFTGTIPANSIGANGMFMIIMQSSAAANNANSKVINVRISGTSIATVTLTSNLYSKNIITLSNRNATNSQIAGNAGSQAQVGTGTSTIAPATYAFDTTTALTVTVTIQNANSGDTTSLESFQVIAIP